MATDMLDMLVSLVEQEIYTRKLCIEKISYSGHRGVAKATIYLVNDTTESRPENFIIKNFDDGWWTIRFTPVFARKQPVACLYRDENDLTNLKTFLSDVFTIHILNI